MCRTFRYTLNICAFPLSIVAPPGRIFRRSKVFSDIPHRSQGTWEDKRHYGHTGVTILNAPMPWYGSLTAAMLTACETVATSCGTCSVKRCVAMLHMCLPLLTHLTVYVLAAASGRDDPGPCKQARHPWCTDFSPDPTGATFPRHPFSRIP